MKLFFEILAWAAFAAVVGLLSVWPRYSLVDEGNAIITVTFAHAAQRVGECRILTQDELNELPPNMRKPSDCPRERHVVRFELRSGERVLYKDTLLPSGIWSDGKANIYQRVVIPAGTHDIFVGMNDSGSEEAFDYEARTRVEVAPGRNIVVSFEPESGEFTVR
ncbi:MAG: hypothetical protein OEY37_06790 [Gammaproteobacteria bacterium]|nr:hypothetical protein [Gammaproteobacteria bacterium]MDH5619449.1 hypothetical protein [Gammaproteobacteria bacterium]